VSIEVIKVIKEAEEKAESIKRDAAVQAKLVITNANSQAQSILDEAKKTAESNRADVLTSFFTTALSMMLQGNVK
jgi:vacuolar-type H+-ATPase subunit H